MVGLMNLKIARLVDYSLGEITREKNKANRSSYYAAAPELQVVHRRVAIECPPSLRCL
jgi:hypothetical protein